MFSHMARGLNAHGVTVAVMGYDLCPEVTIAEIIEQVRHACLFLWLRTGQRMMVYGHSAGGHLAGAMLATDWHARYPKAPPDLVPAAYSISGLFDLTPLVGIPLAQDLRLDEEEARRVSPLFWPAPKGRSFDAIAGALESSEFLRQSRTVADVWGKAGAQTRYEAIAGTNHFTVIDGLADPQNAMVTRLAELAWRPEMTAAPAKRGG
jgi:arylformamidase